MPVNGHETHECLTVEVDHQYPEDLITENTRLEDLDISIIDDDADGFIDHEEISYTEVAEDTEDEDDEEEDEDAFFAMCEQQVDTIISLLERL